MNDKTVYFTEAHRFRIERLLLFSDILKDDERKIMHRLHFDMSQGRIAPADQIPSEVVTIDARVQLENVDTGTRFWMTVVFPEDADAQNNRISVLTPFGTLLIGSKAGDTIKWDATADCYNLKIIQVEQYPEAPHEPIEPGAKA